MRLQMRLQLAAVAASLSLATALSGCSSGATSNAIGAGAGSSAPASSAPAGSAAVPSAGQLQGALLAASDLGPDFTAQPGDTTAPTNTPAPTGCSALTDLMNAAPSTSPNPAQGPDAQVILEGSQTGPFVGEFLSARPQPVLDRNYPAVVKALHTCQELNFPTGSTQVPFQLSDFDMGTSGSTAKHLSGTVQGVPINGYLAVDRLTPTVALVYLYLEVAGDSPQTAKTYFEQAVSKVQATLQQSATPASV
ncbi:hypothetical protein DN069_37170 [Streptacidiphilus pinicola]|uniref:Sensor domain-containing protein n=1 Tax=Streptacidiphilus pinicola TaxID=2219663 RepID=A0A2X0JUM9_9ACTN|nr:hypothetical protein [Streptacidiphilus pinicola]RAG80615.1 hypothetical protein DN069_37170 [Streptacidiphilus pinicola]